MAALLFLAIGPEWPHQKRSEFGSVPDFAAAFQMHDDHRVESASVVFS
jgi:hypothetical protein